MWSSLSLPWRTSFEQCWIAYYSGSIPIGAVVVHEDGGILSTGRSFQHETGEATLRQISLHPLSHAEVNALLGLDYELINPYECELFTIVEPCPLCIGAIAMSRIKKLQFAARDPYAGSADLLSSSDYLKSKQIMVRGPQFEDFEDVIIAIQTEFFLRTQRPSSERVLAAWEKVLPRGVSLGMKLFDNGELSSMAARKTRAEDVLTYLESVLATV